MKKNNNNQILYLSLPLYGKFTFKIKLLFTRMHA